MQLGDVRGNWPRYRPLDPTGAFLRLLYSLSSWLGRKDIPHGVTTPVNRVAAQRTQDCSLEGRVREDLERRLAEARRCATSSWIAAPTLTRPLDCHILATHLPRNRDTCSVLLAGKARLSAMVSRSMRCVITLALPWKRVMPAHDAPTSPTRGGRLGEASRRGMAEQERRRWATQTDRSSPSCPKALSRRTGAGCGFGDTICRQVMFHSSTAVTCRGMAV
jgi:hypothetical protein